MVWEFIDINVNKSILYVKYLYWFRIIKFYSIKLNICLKKIIKVLIGIGIIMIYSFNLLCYVVI